MDIFEFLDNRMRTATHHLEELLSSFDHMDTLDREEMIMRSGAIFDIIISTIKIEDNQLYPKLLAKGLLKQEYQEAKALQQEIEQIIEASVLIHVDEPSFEFRRNLRNMLQVVIKYRRLNDKSVYPVAKTALSHHEMQDLIRHVQGEMTHEGHADLILQDPY